LESVSTAGRRKALLVIYLRAIGGSQRRVDA